MNQRGKTKKRLTRQRPYVTQKKNRNHVKGGKATSTDSNTKKETATKEKLNACGKKYNKLREQTKRLMEKNRSLKSSASASKPSLSDQCDRQIQTYKDKLKESNQRIQAIEQKYYQKMMKLKEEMTYTNNNRMNHRMYDDRTYRYELREIKAQYQSDLDNAEHELEKAKEKYNQEMERYKMIATEYKKQNKIIRTDHDKISKQLDNCKNKGKSDENETIKKLESELNNCQNTSRRQSKTIDELIAENTRLDNLVRDINTKKDQENVKRINDKLNEERKATGNEFEGNVNHNIIELENKYVNLQRKDIVEIGRAHV